jgi:hypothetical protein
VIVYEKLFKLSDKLLPQIIHVLNMRVTVILLFDSNNAIIALGFFFFTDPDWVI